MKLIKRPDWDYLTIMKNKDLDNWFNTNLKGHYAIHRDDLVRVSGRPSMDIGEEFKWVEQTYKQQDDSHQAYLIKSSIEPIKKETAKDVLRDFCGWGKQIKDGTIPKDSMYKLIDRAKSIIEEPDND